MIEFHYPFVLLAAVPIVFFIIIIIRRDFIKFKDKIEQEQYTKKRKKIRLFVSLSRTIIFLCLLIALAFPYTTRSVTYEGDYTLLILADNSSSFNLFNQNIAENLKNALEKKIPVNLKYIASDVRSEIGNSILNNMQGNDNILLISDGNNNYGRELGDVMLLASTLNTTINSLDISPVLKDASVSIEGPSKVIIDSENDFLIKVIDLGSLEYNLIVRVDNEIIVDETSSSSKEFVLKKKFSEGYHEIEARIIANDYFEQNNIYYKTIKVEPRPEVLFVSEKAAPMLQILSSIYSVSSMTDIPSDINKYAAVVLDDVNIEKIKPKTDLMRNYITNGNGLVVVGGPNSFEYGGYEKSVFESLLPARVGVAGEYTGGIVNIVIVIDISGSTSANIGLGEKYRVETAIASGIIGGLREDDNIGVIAFDTEAIPISYLTPLSTKPDLNMTILTLKSRGGGTEIYYGLLEAKKWLDYAEGGKNVVLISDGQTMNPGRALILANSMGEEGIKVFTVGVGTGTSKDYMQSLAEAGKGLYFEGDDAPKLNIVFGEAAKKQEKKSMELVVINKNHFITNGMELNGDLSGYNQVVPKPNAKLLVSTISSNPILTVWRIGLGRVAVLSTDDGNSWGGVLLNKDNSKIITRTLNWAIGDLSRNKAFDIDVKDTRINELGDINVFSKKPFSSDQYQFSKIDDNLYNAKFVPESKGFTEILGAKTAVNYESEYQQIGINPELKKLVTITGGRNFNPENTDEIAEAVKTMSRKTKTEVVSLRWIFTLIALILFLMEVSARRIAENRNIFK